MNLRRNRKNFPFTNSLPTNSPSDLFWRQELERLYNFLEQEINDDFGLISSSTRGNGDTIEWGSIVHTPTSLAGYGITDAQPKDADLTAIAQLDTVGYVKRTGTNTWGTVASIPWSDVSSTPTTLSGYGITDAVLASDFAAFSASLAAVAFSGSFTDLLDVPDFGSLYQPLDTTLSTLSALSDSAGWLHNDGAGVLSYSTPTKADVGLGSVEDTALSTWAGSSNITSLGTIGTGVWQGTQVANSYIVTALTGKTYNGLTLTAQLSGFTIAGGTSSKTLTVAADADVSGTNTGDQDLSGYVSAFRTINGYDLTADIVLTPTDLGLSNVENTALSTWGGSTNLTTLGTITTGVWHGTQIAGNHGGTGQSGYTIGDILYADSGTSLIRLPAVAVGQVLISQGVATGPAWSGSPTLTGTLTVTGASIVVSGGNPYVNASDTTAGNAGYKFSDSSTEAWRIDWIRSDGHLRFLRATSIEQMALSSTGLAVTGTLSTSAPAGSSVQPWKLGNVQAGAVTADLTKSIYVDIAGTVYKLLVAA